MNEQLQNKLVEIITSIQGAVKAGADFAMEQLPDVVMQYLLYGRAQITALFFIITCFCIAALYVTLRYGLLNTKAVYTSGYSAGEWKMERVLSTVIGAILLVTLAPGFFIYLSDLLLVWLAPKVWLLKELHNMVR